jgi:hypothetical protein
VPPLFICRWNTRTVIQDFRNRKFLFAFYVVSWFAGQVGVQNGVSTLRNHRNEKHLKLFVCILKKIYFMLKSCVNELPGSYCFFIQFMSLSNKQKQQTPWPESASELYWPSDRRLSAKLVPTFADRRCRVVSAADPNCRIFGFLDQSLYFFFQVAPQLYSRGWVEPVSDTTYQKIW